MDAPIRRALTIIAVLSAAALIFALPALPSPERMRAPDSKPAGEAAPLEPETSVTRLFFLGAVGVFQRYISPTDGDRCGFSPSCSAFGRAAVHRQGPLLGVIITADRLMRCTMFKHPGPDYLLLSDGRLFDPLENNLLWLQ